MIDKYSWRDGWALTYPHDTQTKVRPEPITRCLFCGAWIIMNKACNTCGTESK